MFGRDKRAEVIRAVIEEYDDEGQGEIAQALDVWGAAMQVAAEPFLDAD